MTTLMSYQCYECVLDWGTYRDTMDIALSPGPEFTPISSNAILSVDSKPVDSVEFLCQFVMGCQNRYRNLRSVLMPLGLSK